MKLTGRKEFRDPSALFDALIEGCISQGNDGIGFVDCKLRYAFSRTRSTEFLVHCAIAIEPKRWKSTDILLDTEFFHDIVGVRERTLVLITVD